MKLKSICIVGVDGTGKSSLVQMLTKSLGEEDAVVQYMGLKDWETNMGKKFLTVKKKQGLYIYIMRILSIFVEMHHRVYKHRGGNKIVIFDRYVDERILSRQQSKKGSKSDVLNLIYKIFFLHLFYRPSLTFYLECPIECSVKRKDDIISEADIQNLRKNKFAYDAYYKGMKDVITIDTSTTGQEETLKIVLSECKKKGIIKKLQRNDTAFGKHIYEIE